jgi:hypothetical protein
VQTDEDRLLGAREVPGGPERAGEKFEQIRILRVELQASPRHLHGLGGPAQRRRAAVRPDPCA